MQDPTDPLSPLGRRLLTLDPNAYAELVHEGDGNPAALDLLENIQPADLVAGKVASANDGAAMIAGLWLRYDWLHQSHRVSQALENPTGSYWHAIMHRREGDFSNSKYWYARAGNHPAYQTLAASVGRLVNAMPADKSLLRVVATGWNSAAFVDLVEAVHEDPSNPRHALAVTLQQMEWSNLFDHCTRAAAGK
jgi:hypothetical protein